VIPVLVIRPIQPVFALAALGVFAGVELLTPGT
jgi:hypothetical protein